MMNSLFNHEGFWPKGRSEDSITVVSGEILYFYGESIEFGLVY